MTANLASLCFDANAPLLVARFWGGVLRWEMADDAEGGVELVPTDDTGFRLRFLPSDEKKTGQNYMHFDLTSNLEPQQQTVERVLSLGARHIDIGQRPDEGHVVLADPKAMNSVSSRRATSSLLSADSSVRSPVSVRRRLATSGAKHSAGRWSGTRTKRLPFARRVVARKSPGAVSHGCRGPPRTGCTSISPQRAISKRRSTVSFHSERVERTSGKATSVGRC
jgi:Glyoxalase-like domain